jgi:hypothetical protein
LCHRDSKSLLRAARALRGMSQAALGEAIGRDRSWISRLGEGLERQIKDNRPAGVFLSSGAPRALGSRPASYTRGNRERGG